jgi:hypothetical protein
MDGGKFGLVQDDAALAVTLVRSRAIFSGGEPNSDGCTTRSQFEFALAAEDRIGQFFEHVRSARRFEQRRAATAGCSRAALSVVVPTGCRTTLAAAGRSKAVPAG